MNGVDAVDVDVEMFWSLIYLVEVRVCIRKGVVRCQFCVRFFCFFFVFQKKLFSKNLTSHSAVNIHTFN